MDLAATLASRRQERTARRQRKSMATPARIMVPRVVLYVCALSLTLFGLLMIYSASSVMALSSADYDNNPAYFVIRQAEFAGVGLLLCVVLAHLDYRAWHGMLLAGAWAVTVLMLALIYTPLAQGAYGASRWISVAGFTLQPSELAKVTVVLTAANVCRRYYQDGELERGDFIKLLVIGVLIPLGLILFQPDKGTTGILVLTVLIMLYLAGMPARYLVGLLLAGVTLAVLLALRDDYSRQRVLTMFNPFLDPYGAGYQLVQGFYAFASGGIFGVGLGLSRQKYSYLPMAHNDFIFAVIGEELGLVGTLGVLAAFALLVWAGLKIAEYAPDLTGRLVAAGCTSLIAIQLLLNVYGVLGMFPLSGKPVPFISYGGTSIVSCLMLVGLIASVSRHSTLPVTDADRRRGRLRVVGGAGSGEAHPVSGRRVREPEARDLAGARSRTRAHERAGRASGAGRPEGGAPDGTRRDRPAQRSSLRLVEGGRSQRGQGASRHGDAPEGYGRTRLDDDPAARLRVEDVQVRDGRSPRRRR